MISNQTYIDLLNKPACTLTALEQYFVTKYCDEHMKQVEDLFLDAHPEALPLLTTQPMMVVAEPTAPKKRMVRGIKGLAQELGCCLSTAQKIKNSGKIDKAISQHGRVLLIDIEKAMQLMSADPWSRRLVGRR